MSVNLQSLWAGTFDNDNREGLDASSHDGKSDRTRKLEEDLDLMRRNFQTLQKDLENSKDDVVNLRQHMKQKDQKLSELTLQIIAVKAELDNPQNSESQSSFPQTESDLKHLLEERDGRLSKQIIDNRNQIEKMKLDLDELRASSMQRGSLRRYSCKFKDPNMTAEDYADDEDLVNREDDEHCYLPGDTFSYFAVADYFRGYTPTNAFCLALFTLCIQLLTLSLFMVDVFDTRNGFVYVPPGVGLQVRVSQLIALLISCWNQDELRASFNVIYLGFHTDKAKAISPYATKAKWYFSLFVRILLGCLSLLVNFFLIIGSESVRDVMLDFTAVMFVSELDNGAFLLSLWGYMGEDIQEFTWKIKNIPVYKSDIDDDGAYKRRIRIPRLLSLSVTVCIMCFAWAWVTIKQSQGDFMDETIFVQFGDDFSPAIGAFSGLYHIEVDPVFDGMRVNYVDLETGGARFKFCMEDSTWLFQYDTNPDKDGFSGSYSDCWFKSRSSETGLDIMRASTLAWYVWDDHRSLEMPMQHLYVDVRNNYYGQVCESSYDCGERMFCDNDTKTCICTNRHFGINCEFLDPCQTLELDPRDENGFFDTRSWSRQFSSIQEDGKDSPLQVYGKPVYIGDGLLADGTLDVIFFIGRRWILTDSSHIEDYEPSSALSGRDLAEFLANNFHAYWSNYTFYFASEPVDVGTPTDSATPIDLRWFRLQTRGKRGVSLREGEEIWHGQEIEVNLFCAVCHNETNPCSYGASCNLDGTCDCITGSSGTLCQIPPSGNGLCNTFFNTPEFSFDGGDCCQETCSSTEEYSCGRMMLENTAGVSAFGFVGYPHCQDPRFSSKLSGSTTLFEIIERGTVRCGSKLYRGFVEFSDGLYSGFEADLCRVIASAVLGDPEAFEIFQTGPSDRFTDLADGKFDVLISTTTHTAERDIYQGSAQVGFSFAPIPTLYDGLRFGVLPPYSECADRIDYQSPECLNLRICVATSTSWLQATESLFPTAMVVGVESDQAEVDGLEAGLCNVVAGEITLVAEPLVRHRGFTGPLYSVGKNIYSKEPLSAVTRQDDRVWSKFVAWIFEALIQAEESGVTKSTADSLDQTEAFGEPFKDMFRNAVAALGNFGEIYEKNLQDILPRSGLNGINRGDTGHIYAFPFGAISTQGQDPIVGGSLDTIRKRGTLNCGIQNVPGFASIDTNTRTWTGFEVDICRGVAAALFSGSPNVNFIALTSSERFIALSEGTVDVLTGITTYTLTRELNEVATGEGFDFTSPIFYDGMGFGGQPYFVDCADNLVFNSSSNVFSECPNTKICAVDGTTHIEAIVGPLSIPDVNIIVAATHEELYDKFISGECNVIAGESAHTAESTVRALGYPEDSPYVASAKKFTKEPLAVVSRSDDAQFSDFLRWLIFSFFYAAEQDITRDEFFNMPSSNFLFGSALSAMWQHAVGAVGSYDEMFERNFEGQLARGGLNNLNDDNGPQFFAKPGVSVTYDARRRG